jgi:hypothetical protein
MCVGGEWNMFQKVPAERFELVCYVRFSNGTCRNETNFIFSMGLLPFSRTLVFLSMAQQPLVG